MNGEFFYFNPRLTRKLNMIRQYPLTIVNAHRSVGRRTAINAYISNVKGRKIWHTVRENTFRNWWPDFLLLLMEECTGGSKNDLDRAVKELPESADPVVKIAVYLKKAALQERLFYILEIEGTPDKDTLDFLNRLAKQGVNGLAVIIITEARKLYGYESGINSWINLIRSEDFLLEPEDIRIGFSEKGITLSGEEAAVVFRYTNGWMPIVSEIFHKVDDFGKSAAWGLLRNIAGRWEGMLRDPGDWRYSKNLCMILTWMGFTETFKVEDVIMVGRAVGNGRINEGTIRRELSPGFLPPFLYYSTETGLYHLHDLLKVHFANAFYELPEKDQEKIRKAYRRTVEKECVSDDLLEAGKDLLKMKLEEASAIVKRLYPKRSTVCAENACGILLLNSILEIIGGNASRTLDFLEKQIFALYKAGLFREGEYLIRGSIVLKCFLGDRYSADIEALLDPRLWEETSGWPVQPEGLYMMRSLICASKENWQDLYEVSGEQAADTEVTGLVRMFLHALAEVRLGHPRGRDDLEEALNALDENGFILLAVIYYDKLFVFLQTAEDGPEKHYLETAGEKVSDYRRKIRRNYRTAAGKYGNLLTRRQLEAAELAARGLRNKEIARQMGVSENTVKTTMREVFRKLNIRHRKELQEKNDY